MAETELTPEQIAELTDAANADTREVERLAAAARWAQNTHRAFKGIRGAPNRRQRLNLAVQFFRLNEPLKPAATKEDDA